MTDQLRKIYHEIGTIVYQPHPATPEEQERCDELMYDGLHAAKRAVERGEDPRAVVQAVRDQCRLARAPATTFPGQRIGGQGWTPDKQRAFLTHLATHGCVAHACAHVGLSKQGAYELKQRHPTSMFAMAWQLAARLGRERLLDEATERAYDGREIAVWHRGEQVGTRIVHNDRLLMFLLSLKAEPVHAALSDRELAELWPVMMQEVDAVLPPTLTPERMDAIVEGSENGNDRG